MYSYKHIIQEKRINNNFTKPVILANYYHYYGIHTHSNKTSRRLFGFVYE